MNRESTQDTIRESLAILGIMGLLVTGSVTAQVPVDDDGYPIQAIDSNSYDDSTAIDDEALPLLTASELETLVGPVALYPDDLLAIVLPASTYPLEIVQAARFLEKLESDPTLKPDEDWDESVVALLNYPEVVQMMSDDIDWTWQLGEAIIAQQNDLVAAVEVFRDRAYAVGNLKTDEHQTVTLDDGIIEIEPVDDDIIYVPYYEPEQVVYYSPGPVYHYYPRPYPVYYYPYPAGHYFGSHSFWGVTTAFTIGWASDYLHVYHHSYYGHPYYGHTYYGNRYRHASIHKYNSYYVNNHRRRQHNQHSNGDYWRPRHRGGARPVQATARNNFYSGGRRSNSSSGNYRDDRTDGLAYNSGRTQPGGTFRSSSRSSEARQSRERNSSANAGVARNTNRNRQASGSANGPTARSTLNFKRRDKNTYSGSVARRIEAGQDNSTRPNATRSRESTSNSNPVRFRTRDNAGNTALARNNARRTGFTSNSDRAKPVTQARPATQPRQSTRRSQQRPATSRRAQPQQVARASQPSRQATQRSQPRQASRSSQTRPAASGRPASSPPKARRSSESKSSSRSAAAPARSNKGPSGSSRPSRPSRKSK
jgi:hypothetical protein